MRVLVMFDLPSVTREEKKEYRKFRRFLIKSGFIMMQESIYTKLTLNQNQSASIEKSIYLNRPKNGLVQMLTITEKQFAKIRYIVGENKSEFLDTDDRMIIL
ncbi:MAG: CRISPR-associated endonuclease Cas2 [Tissierellia bacterium]|nr:CRISPR-associated endonuclease Cas2 [Tissierellia bacterium]